MIQKIKTRMASEQGFTLIELLVVIVIIGILVAIAVPSYLSFRSRAQTAAAEANVRTAIPAAESFYQTGQTYAGMDGTALRTEAPGIAATVEAGPGTSNAQEYCIQDSTDGGTTYYHYAAGGVGDATISSGPCDSTEYTIA